VGNSNTEQQPERGFSLLLDDQMCFALYAASRAVTGLYRPMLEELGLTYPQYLVLLVLWERGEASVKDLGTALHLDYGTLTPLLKRLETNGLLRRERRPDDERSVWITLTDEGAALRERSLAIPAAIGDAMGLDPDEFERTRAALRRLTDNVAARTAGR
jgi:DNA-binding MarR family transcriptional regulator